MSLKSLGIDSKHTPQRNRRIRVQTMEPSSLEDKAVMNKNLFERYLRHVTPHTENDSFLRRHAGQDVVRK